MPDIRKQHPSCPGRQPEQVVMFNDVILPSSTALTWRIGRISDDCLSLALRPAEFDV